MRVLIQSVKLSVVGIQRKLNGIFISNLMAEP